MRLLSIHKTKGLMWFRILGYGLSFNKKERISQRIGAVKTLRLVGWNEEKGRKRGGGGGRDLVI